MLRVYGLTAEKAATAATRLALPLTLTMRGCTVYATKSTSAE